MKDILREILKMSIQNQKNFLIFFLRIEARNETLIRRSVLRAFPRAHGNG